LPARSARFHRLTFNEITKKAIVEALKHPRTIDEKMVAAQRRVAWLDRLVGYKISPLLWDKVRRGLSAGRVQSVALKLVCDRERDIERFVPEEYWHLFARLAGPLPPEFDAKLLKHDGDTVKVANEEQSKTIVAELERVEWTVARSRRKSGSATRRRHSSRANSADRAVPGQEDDDARAAVVRGHRVTWSRRGRSSRPHHVHAHRLGARRRRSLAEVRDHIKTHLAATICRRRRTSTNRKPTRRMPTRPFGRPRCSTIPRPSKRISRRISIRSIA
jgi:hypothetical protein